MGRYRNKLLFAQSFELELWTRHRPLPPGVAESAANPFAYRKLFKSGNVANFSHFALGQQNLESHSSHEHINIGLRSTKFTLRAEFYSVLTRGRLAR